MGWQTAITYMYITFLPNRYCYVMKVTTDIRHVDIELFSRLGLKFKKNCRQIQFKYSLIVAKSNITALDGLINYHVSCYHVKDIK